MVLDEVKNAISVFKMGGLSVGLDIGGAGVKVVAVKSGNLNRPKLVAIGYADTPPGCVVDGILNDAKTMAEIIKHALNDAKLSPIGLKANIGLRGLNVIYKNLLLAKGNPDEIKQQVLVESQQLLDTDLDDWIIDSNVLGDSDDGQVHVLLVAAKRSGAEDFGNLLLSCEINPGVFDCDIFAFQNLAAKSMTFVGNTLLLDIGKDTTKISLLQNGVLQVVRGISFGGSMLTEGISRNLNIDYEEAEALKISLNQSPEINNQREVKEAISEHIEELLQEIRRSFEFIKNKNITENDIDLTLLTGGGSLTGGLREALQERMQSTVSFFEPFQIFDVPANLQERISQFSQIFTVAAGLSIRKASGNKS